MVAFESTIRTVNAFCGSQATERSGQLRQQVLTAIETFAVNEEHIARLHDDLAASQPGRRDEYRRVAEQARDTARTAREMLRSASTGPGGPLNNG